MNTFSIQNIIDGQAIWISLTGMSIVFCGLVLITIAIALLPSILERVSRRSIKRVVPRKKPAQVDKKPDVKTVSPPAQTKAISNEYNDIASVIGLVLQLEQERISKTENEQITISRNNNRLSQWSSAGRMRKMPQRRTHAQI